MELKPKKLASTEQTDESLQTVLGMQEVAGEETEQEGKGENQPKPSKFVTFYTRVGDKYDSKTGKERPARKHVVTRAEWPQIKDSLPRLGYKLVRVEE